MREIKFRAWDAEENKFWYFTLQEILERRMSYRGSWDDKILRCEKTQYTGLKDKNGKEIYEGDIVKYTFDLPESTYATEIGLKIRIDKVFWSDWRSSFSIGNELANNDLFRYVRNGNRVEVIGNIYDNPELLEVV